MITRNPAIRILYISSTSNLATKQLKFIKDILTCDEYRRYWPEMVNAQESAREKWTTDEISVDHPMRKAEIIRDPTIFTAGLTTGITGLHCDVAVLDDVVVDDTAYSEEGRGRVRSQVSYLASILGAEGQLWAVGTRYHPLDLYQQMEDTDYDIFDKEGNIDGEESLYEVFERKVEDIGDGTGTFLWPRVQRSDGKWFGFNRDILAKKKAQYADPTQFRSQYYNDPNDVESSTIKPLMFQYYDRGLLTQGNGHWYYKDRRINIAAAMDFAYSIRKGADYSTIAVVGVDAQNNYYVMDLERFKTNQISEYFNRLLRLHVKWDFRKIKMEVTVAQEAIVESLKNDYIKTHGLALAIETFRPTRDKGERIESVLQPKYNNRQIWHYHGGHTQSLEEELILQNPAHDDLKDSLANAIEVLIRPSVTAKLNKKQLSQDYDYHRFGGIN
jgi:phage terminase large subunit-like protein